MLSNFENFICATERDSSRSSKLVFLPVDLDQNAKSLLPTTWWQNCSMAELAGQQASLHLPSLTVPFRQGPAV